MAMKSLKPYRVVAADWRGGRVIAVDVETVTLSVRAEQHIVREYTVARAFYIDASVGSPCIVRILNPGAGCDNYVIGDMRSAGWAGAAHTSEHPNWGHVEYGLTNESPYWDWTAD